jgi:hypothetical protein
VFRIHWQHLSLEIVSVSSASGTWCRRACGEHRAVRCASASRNEPQGEDAGEPKHHWRGSRRSWMKLSRKSPGFATVARAARALWLRFAHQTYCAYTAPRPALRHPPPPEYAWSTPAPYCATCSIQLRSASWAAHRGTRRPPRETRRTEPQPAMGAQAGDTVEHRWYKRILKTLRFLGARRLRVRGRAACRVYQKCKFYLQCVYQQRS